MSESVQQRPGEKFRGEDLGPLVERQVGGDQDGPPIVVLGEEPVDQISASLTGPRPMARSGNSSPWPDRMGAKPVCAGKRVPEQLAAQVHLELFLERS